MYERIWRYLLCWRIELFCLKNFCGKLQVPWRVYEITDKVLQLNKHVFLWRQEHVDVSVLAIYSNKGALVKAQNLNFIL